MTSRTNTQKAEEDYLKAFIKNWARQSKFNPIDLTIALVNPAVLKIISTVINVGESDANVIKLREDIREAIGIIVKSANNVQ